MSLRIICLNDNSLIVKHTKVSSTFTKVAGVEGAEPPHRTEQSPNFPKNRTIAQEGALHRRKPTISFFAILY